MILHFTRCLLFLHYTDEAGLRKCVDIEYNIVCTNINIKLKKKYERKHYT